MIEKYLLSTCLFVIDDFNEKYKGIPVFSEKLREEADSGYSEADLVVRIGYPFRQMANFIMQSSKGKRVNGNDIVVKSKDFRIEVKYLKTFKSESGTQSNKTPWFPLEEDFRWLMEEILKGNQGKRAFIIGWFNSTERFSEQIQLGDNAKKGPSRMVDISKIIYFPFLDYDPKTKATTSVTYRYDFAFEPCPISIPGFKQKMSCLFLGEPEDKFHIAIYY